MLRASLRSAICALAFSAACGQPSDHADSAQPVSVGAPADSLLLPPPVQVPACVGIQVDAEPLQVDLFAVVDRSSSMDEATSTGVSKWYATKSAFRDFLEHAPRGMGFGLSLFPVPGDDSASCRSARYREAALPIAEVSQMMQGALTQFDSVGPGGRTPTAPAFSAALELASAHALSHRDRSVVVVLATDGMPTACVPTDALALAELARSALERPGHVRTLVVASRSLSGPDASGFASIAVAGGTQRPLAIDPQADFARQLGDALSSAATREVACDLVLPEPASSRRLDYDAVNVVLAVDSGRRLTLPRVSGPSACTQAGGWYYDVDPGQGAPSRLDMCASSCARASAPDARRLYVEFGCRTVVR